MAIIPYTAKPAPHLLFPSQEAVVLPSKVKVIPETSGCSKKADILHLKESDFQNLRWTRSLYDLFYAVFYGQPSKPVTILNFKALRHAPPDAYCEDFEELFNLIDQHEDTLTAWSIFYPSLASPADFLIHALSFPGLSSHASTILTEQSFWLTQLDPKGTGRRKIQDFLESPGFFKHVDLLHEVIKRTPSIYLLNAADGSCLIDWLLTAIERCKKQPVTRHTFKGSHDLRCIEFVPGLITLERLWESLRIPESFPLTLEKTLRWTAQASRLKVPATPILEALKTSLASSSLKRGLITHELLKQLSTLNPDIATTLMPMICSIEHTEAVLQTLGAIVPSPSSPLSPSSISIDFLPSPIDSPAATTVSTPLVENSIFTNPKDKVLSLGWFGFLEKVCKTLEKQDSSSIDYYDTFEKDLITLASELPTTEIAGEGANFCSIQNFLYCLRIGFFDLALKILSNQKLAASFCEALSAELMAPTASAWVKRMCIIILTKPKAYFLGKKLLFLQPKLFSKLTSNDWKDKKLFYVSSGIARSMYDSCDEIDLKSELGWAHLSSQYSMGNFINCLSYFKSAPDDFKCGFFSRLTCLILDKEQIGALYHFLCEEVSFIEANPSLVKLLVFLLLERRSCHKLKESFKLLKHLLGDSDFSDYINLRPTDGVPSITEQLVLDKDWEAIDILLDLKSFHPENLSQSLLKTLLSIPETSDHYDYSQVLIQKHSLYFANQLVIPHKDGISDLEFVLDTQPRAVARYFLDLCLTEEVPLFQAQCLIYIRSKVSCLEFGNVFFLLKNVPYIANQLSLDKWHQIFAIITRDPGQHIHLTQLRKHLRPQMLRLSSAQEKENWRALFCNFYKEALERNLEMAKRFAAEFCEILAVSPLQLAAFILVCPSCIERDQLLENLAGSSQAKAWKDKRSQNSLLYYVCQEAPSAAKTTAIESLLSVKALSCLALERNKTSFRNETGLHLLLAQNDQEAALAYIRHAPSSIFVTNEKNLSALQLIAINSAHSFRDMCLSLFQTSDMRNQLFQGAFRQGVRLGYLTEEQRIVLGLPEIDPDAYSSEFFARIGQPELLGNPLARHYFFPRPSTAFEEYYSVSTSVVREWYLQLAVFAPLKTYLNEVLNIDKTAFTQFVSPSTFLYSQTRSWDLGITVPSTFISELETTLKTFLGMLDSMGSSNSRVAALLATNEISSIEACHRLASDLIDRFKHEPHIKGLSGDTTERKLYYKRLKQVVFLIHNNCKATDRSDISEVLSTYLSIISVGGLCAFSIDDLKMLAAPYIAAETASSSEEVYFKETLLKLAAEYRLHIAHTLAGRYIETNVHATDGLKMVLKDDFGVGMEIADPYAPHVPFSTYSLIDEKFLIKLAIEQYHYEGLIRFLLNEIKQNPALLKLTCESLLKHDCFFSFVLKERLNPLKQINREVVEQIKYALSSDSSNRALAILLSRLSLPDTIKEFDFREFFDRNRDIATDSQCEILHLILSRTITERLFNEFLYAEELKIVELETGSIGIEEQKLFYKDLQTLFETVVTTA